MSASLIRAFLRFFEMTQEFALLFWLVLPVNRVCARTKEVIPVIVSMTSFPARIDRAWIAIETICRQSVRPEKFLLVLSREEFESRKIPRRIRRLEGKCLEILWTQQNGFSFDKLLPVLSYYPGRPILTVDDDKLFPRELLRKMYEASIEFPGHVIGARGWIVRRSERDFALRYGENWSRVVEKRQGHDLITPGGNGCLYPPGSLDPRVTNLEAALRECPTADDVWFWAAAQKKGTSTVCLGMPPHRAVHWLRTTPALSAVNEERNDHQLQRAVNYFGLELDHIS
jgi:hypothetical protein